MFRSTNRKVRLEEFLLKGQPNSKIGDAEANVDVGVGGWASDFYRI